VFSDGQLEILLKEDGTQRIKVLMLLASIGAPTTPTAIREKAMALGFRGINNWNVSQVLKEADDAGLVNKVPDGWKLMPKGADYLKNAGLPVKSKLVADTLHDLQKHLAAVADPERRAFIKEAVDCFEQGLNRPAVVFSWVGAAWILQNHVVANHLAAFNKAGAARANFKPITSMKSFAEMREADFLQICQDAGILDKTEKNQLKERLDLRNACGHPNHFEIAQHTVASHLEILLLNVFEKY
jgi:hypothetical protein